MTNIFRETVRGWKTRRLGETAAKCSCELGPRLTERRSRILLRAFCLLTLLISISGLLSCGGATAAPINGADALGPVSVVVSPSSMTIATGTTQTLTATVNNASVSAVQWFVNGIPGGGGSLGTIDSSGNYTAPQFVPNPANVTVTAVANADDTKSGSAQVTIVGALLPAQVAISPTQAYIQVGTSFDLAAAVIGPADTSVVWQVVDEGKGIVGGDSSVGTIVPTSAGGGTAVYRAPATVPAAGTVRIRAVSHAETNMFATCTVVLSVQPPTVPTVTISPLRPNVPVGASLPFTATVVGAPGATVLWQVNGTIGGNGDFGTITVSGPNNSVGTFTAPTIIAATGNTVTVTAVVSNGVNVGSSSAVVTLIPSSPTAVSITITPPSANVGLDAEVAFTATVNNAANQNVTWRVNGIPGGNPTYGTITPEPGTTSANYVSPSVLPAQNPVVIDAIPNAAPKIAATASVAIVPGNVTLTVTPPSSILEVGLSLGLNASVAGAGDNQTVTWYVNGVLGGNAAVGTIINNGLNATTYSAPAIVPSPNPVAITAISNADPTVSGTAQVTITAGPAIVLNPATASVEETLGLTLTAEYTGLQNPSLIWSVNGEVGGDPTVNGTITADSSTLTAQYVAPATFPPNNPVIISATDQSSGTKSSLSAITITPFVQKTTITVTPTSAIVMPGQQQQFTADVNPGTDQIVNWMLSGPSGGCNATICGTVTPQTNGNPATYTAPQTIPQDPNIVVTATADAAPHPQATAAIQIAILPASISISPANGSIQAGSTGSVTFVAHVQNVDPTTTSISWTLGCISQAPFDPFGDPENCFDSSGDGGGPGCLQDESGNQSCGASSISDPANVQISYTPPQILGTSFVQNSCTSTAGTDGLVPLTASFNAPNCGASGVCSTSVCITVTPP
jgi:hypothetical protein